MKKNTLGYSNRSSRKPRYCLECKERDLYIEDCAIRIKSKISLRQINRYIDEFMVFLEKNHNKTDIRLVTTEHLKDYINHINSNNLNKQKTNDIKINAVEKWFDWMLKSNIIAKRP